MVKFIEYDGHYPNLCSGILTLEIEGKTVKFGNSKGCDYYQFWCSGGCCGFRNGYEETYVETDK